MSLFESGIGRGVGFWDSKQAPLGFFHLSPAGARQRILALVAGQMASGGPYHQFQPLMERRKDAIGGSFSDDSLWFVLSTVVCLKETRDWDTLEEMAPYENVPGP